MKENKRDNTRRGMTLSEKILAAHCGRGNVEPGELVFCRVDVALGNDVTSPIAIDIMEKAGVKKVFDPDKIIMVNDHFVPNKDIASAQHSKLVRDFARRQNLTWFYDVGTMGIEHALLPEEGLVVPGDLVIGADSHTCTYGAINAFSTGMGSTDLAAVMISGMTWFRVPETLKIIYTGKINPYVVGKDLILHTISKIGVEGARYQAMEFTGPVIENLPMSGRFSMANMAIEAGAKAGLFNGDSLVEEYVKPRAKRPYRMVRSDPDASYARVLEIDVSDLEPQVALPYSPENAINVSETGNIPIDQVVVGSCTNGRYEDLLEAANVLKGRRVAPFVRMIIIPATMKVYRRAVDEGLFQIFLDAGAVISTPTCGPCLGGHMGVLAEGERAVTTTNRNFVGRMGHPASEVYLANPAVAAASAVAGRIIHPGDL
nr:3-isopropylmalate dehydratase large subunit [Desulfobacterales bacterium]